MTRGHTGILSIVNDFMQNEVNYTWVGENGTVYGIFNHTMPSGPWYWPWCPYWKHRQHLIFQLASTLLLISFSMPSTKRGQLWMYTLLIFAYMLLSIWSWHVICAPDAFSWNFAFMFLNLAQVVFLVYQMRPVKFDPELEEIYHSLFAPFKVKRRQFKKMVSPEFATIMSLHTGEAYAMQNLTKTDRLGLLLSGKVNVMNGQQFLHPILPCEFLDSPEFESSRATVEEKFRVSIVAASSCRYLYWQRTALEYLFVKETYLASVLSTLIARDITTKLYAMNNKIVTERGSHLDIRLPSITGTLCASSSSPPPFIKSKCLTNYSPKLSGSPRCNGRYNKSTYNGDNSVAEYELEPLTKGDDEHEPSMGSGSLNCEDSKYQSCEALEDKQLLVPTSRSE